MPDGSGAPQRCCDVPIWHLLGVWPQIERFVEKSLARDPLRRFRVDDVFSTIADGRSKLWVAYDRERAEFDGFIVTDVIDWPCAKECRAWLGGGQHMRLWLDEIRRTIEAYARDQGCTHCFIIGRKGWARMPGYRICGLEIVKEI
jgi:hypothetical protein